MEIINYDILLRLLTAHFLGDFFLQTKSWVEDKNKKKIKSFYLYSHCVIHGLLVYLLLFDFANIWVPAIIIISHLILDILKIYLQKDDSFGLIVDQFMHFIVILVIWIIASNQFNQIYNLIENFTLDKRLWLILSSYLFITRPASIIIIKFMEKWKNENFNKNSLKDAGEWIGYFERFLTLTFILLGQFGVVGFLLAAKSVFRFGDLKETNEIKFTEFVLVGTLASFSLVIIVGILLKKLLIYK
ncbi:MAG: DUF3307 domain-containing protein [Ignavibacteria bacterium]|jgi:hypothetical protein